MNFKQTITLLITVLLIAIPATGQTSAVPKEETETTEQIATAARTKLNAQTFELLDAVIKDAEQLKLPQNRIYFSVSSAELLWTRDEKTARALFKNAITDFRAIMAESDDGEMPRAYRQRMESAQLREQILFALARHDGRASLAFLTETRPDVSANSDSQEESERDLETRLAMVIAANDPKQAIELARISLAKGFSSELLSLVFQIQRKDSEAAAVLANEIVAKLKTVDLNTNRQAAYVAVQIFHIATEPRQTKMKAGTEEAKPLLTEQSVRELAELLVSAALSVPAQNPNGVMDVGSILKRLEKYEPSRASELQRIYSQKKTAETEEQRTWQEFQTLSETGTPETLLEAAEKADQPMRDGYYRLAAMKLVEEDKSDRARQIIAEHIKDPNERKRMLAEVDIHSMADAASKGRVEETRKLLSRAKTNDERMTILVQLAMAMSQKGDKKVALQLLEEARNLGTGRARYSRQLLAQLMVARGYASIDPTLSLAILEPTIDQLNELITAAILLGEFFGEEEAVRDDEVVIKFLTEMVTTFHQQFGKELYLLASANFTRTRDAAERFQRFEVRLIARLLVVQSVLLQKDDEKKDETNDLLRGMDGLAPVIIPPQRLDTNSSTSP